MLQYDCEYRNWLQRATDAAEKQIVKAKTIGVELADWCAANCLGQWSNFNPNPFYWYFELHEDAVKFKLKWG